MIDDAKAWRTFVLLSATFFMLLLDFSIVSIALPAIETELSMRAVEAQWIISAYTLLFAGFLLVSGRCADIFGRRRFFVIGLSLFTLASLGAGIANDGTTLIILRGVQGLGAALVNPAALAIATALFTGAKRTKAISMWGVIGSAGVAAGMLLGGILVQAFGWRSVFFVNVPVGALALILTPILVPADRPRDSSQRLDLWGSLVLTASLLLLVFTIVRIGNDPPMQTSLRALGVVALAAMYAAVERRSVAPMVPARVFGYLNFLPGSWIELLQAAAYGGVFVFTAMYLQQVVGLDPLAAGLAFIPATLMMTLVAGPYANKLISRFGVRNLSIVASALMIVGTLMLVLAPRGLPWWETIMPALLIGSWGCMTTYEISMVAGLSEVADVDEGVGSAVVSMAGQIGLSLGTAVCAAIEVASGNLQAVFWGCAVFSVATLGASAFLRSGGAVARSRFTVGKQRLRIHPRSA